MMMVDADNYYAALYPGRRVPHFVLTTYLTLAKNFATNFLSEMLKWMS